MSESAILPEELPPPDPSLVLLRVFAEAHLASADLPRGRRGIAFVQVASEILATEESVSALFPIRPASQHAAVNRSRRMALAWMRHMMPVFLARLPNPRI